MLTAVLQDLLAYKGEDSPLGAFGPERPLPLAQVPDRYEVAAENVLYRHDKKAWNALTAEQAQASREAAQHLVRRAKSESGEFKIDDQRVVLRPHPKDSDFLSTARPIGAHLPGFSADGRLAIVYMSIPWSIHSVGTTYVLSLEDGGWKVVLRQFCYYL